MEKFMSAPNLQSASLRAAIPVALPPVLRRYCWLTFLITAFSAMYCFVLRLVFHAHYPYVWPLYIPRDRFNDFTVYQDKFHLFHQLAFFNTGWPFTYPAPPSIVFEIFFKLGGSHALALFLTFSVLAFVLPALWFLRALLARGLKLNAALALIGAAFCLSWPMWLVLDRGNIEVVVWVVLALGTWAYARGKEWTAAACFGVAASMKLFPFVFLALFFTRKKFPKLLAGGVVFGLTTLISLALLGPTVPIAYKGISDGLAFFHDNYMSKYLAGETGVDHSLLAFAKVIIAVLKHPNEQPALDMTLRIYTPLTAILGLSLYFLRIRKMPWLNQLLLFTIVGISFTPYSGDGTLLHLYYSFVPCCFLALDAWRRQLEIPGLRYAFYCFAYLFATESFVIVHSHRFEGQFKCIAIGILMILALRYPFGAQPTLDENHAIAEPDAALVPSALPLA